MMGSEISNRNTPARGHVEKPARLAAEMDTGNVDVRVSSGAWHLVPAFVLLAHFLAALAG